MFAPELPIDVLQADSNSPELTSWDFLQDFGFGLDPEIGGSSQAQLSAKGTINSSERLREKNRKAQKRFRERKKARTLARKQDLKTASCLARCRFDNDDVLKERAQTTEAQLAETTSQLHDLRLKQRELEARNTLLEKIAALNKQQPLLDSSQNSANTQSNNGSSRQVCRATECYATQPDCSSNIWSERVKFTLHLHLRRSTKETSFCKSLSRQVLDERNRGQQ